VKARPRDARHLRTYQEFESYLSDFVAGLYPFLWVVGRPGVAKTESVLAAVQGRRVYYRKGGQLTPLQFYIDCYRHRGQPLILDDAEYLLDNKLGANLVAALGDTSPAKLLCYASTHRTLGDVPQRYYTNSPLCIIANRGTAHEAIQSRAVTLFFDPTNLEVHRAAAQWFWDQQIHTWVRKHLYRLRPLDSRWYVTADRDKRAGRDWQRIFLEAHALDRASFVVQELETDPAYPTREDKSRRFAEVLGEGSKGGSWATYFRLRKRLDDEGRLVAEAVSSIRLRSKKRPGTPSLEELDSLGAPTPGEPEGEPGPVDIPAGPRAAHAADPGPGGRATAATAPRRQVVLGAERGGRGRQRG
jgi:hypothetical protein